MPGALLRDQDLGVAPPIWTSAALMALIHAPDAAEHVDTITSWMQRELDSMAETCRQLANSVHNLHLMHLLSARSKHTVTACMLRAADSMHVKKSVQTLQTVNLRKLPETYSSRSPRPRMRLGLTHPYIP